MLSVGYVARHGLRLFLGLVKLGKLEELDGVKIKRFDGQARRACCVITVHGAKRSARTKRARYPRRPGGMPQW